MIREGVFHPVIVASKRPKGFIIKVIHKKGNLP
jgi:hypothetical protein